MKEIYRILVINPGSTSTKLAIFENECCVLEKDMDVSIAEIKNCPTVFDQKELRLSSIETFLEESDYTMADIDAIAARGCGGGNQKAGAYIIDESYLELCRTNGFPHISSLSPIIAWELALQHGKVAYVYDAEGVNERDPLTLLSGLKELKVGAGSHTLNAKIVARKTCETIGKNYEDSIVIVCHMGGGVSSSLHLKGRLVDSTYDGYAPERVGGIPSSAVLNFVKLCYSGKYSEADMKKLIMGKGGLVSYLGTSDLREVERRIAEGDEEAAFYYDGMVMGLAKDIASVAATVNMNVDAIAFTGGMAKSKKLVDELKHKVEKIAPTYVFPGSYEMENLATGTLRVLRGEEQPHRFIK